MQVVIDGIRKIVVLVLLMELVLQLQSGKQYEPYIKMLVGIMVVYSIVAGICGAWGRLETLEIAPMQEFVWSGDWSVESEIQEDQDDKKSSVEEIQIDGVFIGKIKIDEIETIGGAP